MSAFTFKTFVATTATALTPFLAVWYLPQQKIQSPTLSALPKPRPLAALRQTREQEYLTKAANEFHLI